ncbi:pseudouridylate synthase [Chitinophaga nivalis]|uniref:Pseudouridylate synthase n=1 Tax=Chitinophaga nivalis TaxID=2991709 RepID=A0ABT3INM8_9BACT|nr:pseudouridylate synthase [Chitinophaga nivalis]MCW3464989.1 pseudouridylate synthase [Chitinophaga nivalis]MCW3485319.1 pseudouridylate synthase [Chitinophaga nivalis]
MQGLFHEDAAFCRFSVPVEALAKELTFSVTDDIHPLCKIAAAELQQYLQQQQDWTHNFGLSANGEGAVIGKMFGVLVVRNSRQELGYLAAFSGKLAGGNHHHRFVPPIFDGVADGGFLNAGMTRLTAINTEIKALEQGNDNGSTEKIATLKALRKEHSIALQRKIFDQYHFMNKTGGTKSLVDIFEQQGYRQPPAGAGECAAPKLLQYAFHRKMEPLALAEFWWGLSPKSATWKHGHFYAPCKEKCAAILTHMLAAN